MLDLVPFAGAGWKVMDFNVQIDFLGEPTELRQRLRQTGALILLLLSSSLRPFDLHFATVGKTVAQVQVNKTLIRNPRIMSRVLEAFHHIF